MGGAAKEGEQAMMDFWIGWLLFAILLELLSISWSLKNVVEHLKKHNFHAERQDYRECKEFNKRLEESKEEDWE